MLQSYVNLRLDSMLTELLDQLEDVASPNSCRYSLAS